MTKYFFLSVALLWFCAALLAVQWVNESKFKDFDPELRLSTEIMSLSMEKELESTLSAYFSSVSASSALASYSNSQMGKIIHVFQGRCFCETLSQSHQQTLNTWAQDKRISFQSLDILALPELTRFVPSTPALIVLNQNNELLYLGPYSTGLGCFDDSGLVDIKIKPYFEDDNKYFKALIQSEARGCYCATETISSAT